MKRNILLMGFIFIFIYCKKTNVNSELRIINYDTIKYDIIIKDKQCYKLSEGYYKKYGFLISNFFEELNYEYKIDLNNDNIDNDTIVVLSPKNMTIPSENQVCLNEEKGNRLLLIKIKDVCKIYKNVINNDFSSGTTGIELIEKTENGFKLQRHLGQSCFFDYEVYINYIKNDYYITQIVLRSGCPGDNDVEKKYEYVDCKFPLIDYRRTIIDSLRIKNKM